MAKLRNPYYSLEESSPAVKESRARVEKHLKRVRVDFDNMKIESITMVVALMLVIVTGALTIAGVDFITGNSPAVVPAMLFGGGAGSLALAFYLAHVASLWAVARKADTAAAYIEVAPEAQKSMTDLYVGLTSLPQEQRFELRPLWESAMAANHILLQVPATQGALEIITERSVLAYSIAKEHERVTEIVLQGRAREEMKPTIVALKADDSDLQAARAHLTALEEGRKVLEAQSLERQVS